EQLLEVLFGRDVAADRIDEIGMPADVHGARNMAALVNAGIDAHLEYADLRIVEVLLEPVGRYQRSVRGERTGAERNGKARPAENGFQRHRVLRKRDSANAAGHLSTSRKRCVNKKRNEMVFYFYSQI